MAKAGAGKMFRVGGPALNEAKHTRIRLKSNQIMDADGKPIACPDTGGPLYLPIDVEHGATFPLADVVDAEDYITRGMATIVDSGPSADSGGAKTPTKE